LRVNGENHWLWVLSTPQEVLCHPDKRRSHEVAEELGKVLICEESI